MWKHVLKHAIALTGALAATLFVFAAVVSLADDERATELAARIKPALVASESLYQRSR